jgi:hypothetical protein
LSFDLVWSGEPLTSQLTRSRLSFRGRIRPMFVCLKNGDTLEFEVRAGKEDTGWGSQLHFDLDQTMNMTGTEVQCLLLGLFYSTVSSSTSARYYLEIMLILEQTSKGKEKYRRLGVGVHGHVRLFSDLWPESNEQDIRCFAKTKNRTIWLVSRNQIPYLFHTLFQGPRRPHTPDPRPRRRRSYPSTAAGPSLDAPPGCPCVALMSPLFLGLFDSACCPLLPLLLSSLFVL